LESQKRQLGNKTFSEWYNLETNRKAFEFEEENRKKQEAIEKDRSGLKNRLDATMQSLSPGRKEAEKGMVSLLGDMDKYKNKSLADSKRQASISASRGITPEKAVDSPIAPKTKNKGRGLKVPTAAEQGKYSAAEWAVISKSLNMAAKSMSEFKLEPVQVNFEVGATRKLKGLLDFDASLKTRNIL